MVCGTHLIKIKGTFDKNKWTEKSLRELVDKKIGKIDSIYHPDLELFNVENNVIDVWLFLSFLAGVKTMKKLVKKWLENNIKEQGIKIEKIEVKAMMDFISEEF